MSRVRTRPTRDDTRDRLFEAAARMFEQDGIGGASIEAIAAAAGFTRGAFYSNFKSKDELIIAMLEDHVEQSIRRNMDILAQHDNLDDFIAALKDDGSHKAGSARPFAAAAHGDDPVRRARREAPA
ncbi:AcrR family transcriptional regulator [Bradyrhizobium sp. LB13.1]